MSRNNNWLFVKTTKVGGTSIELALSRLAGPTPIITPLLPNEELARAAMGYPGPTGHELPISEYTLIQKMALHLKGRRMPPKFRSHSRAQEICDNLGADVFKNMYKFSIVRNPYSYIVSKYNYKIEKSAGKFTLSFREYLLSEPEALLENRRITSVAGENSMNYSVRYENLENDFRNISNRIGLDERFFKDLKEIRLKSDGRLRERLPTPSECFSDFPEGLNLVKTICAEEIEAYGYSEPNQ